jgi:hypothetical protein
MVTMAEEDCIGQVCLTASAPMDQMVSLSPAGRPVATWPDAAFVSDVQRPSGGTRHNPLGSTHVDHHRFGVENHPADGAIAGDAAKAVARDRGGELQLGGASALETQQRLDRAGQLQVRSAWKPLAIESVPGKFNQGIGQAPRPDPLVALALAAGQGFQGGAESSPAFLIQNPANEDQALLTVAGDVQGARFNRLGLIAGIAVGIGAVAGMVADMTKATNTALPSLAQKRLFIEHLGTVRLTHPFGHPSHQGKVGEADLTIGHRLKAVSKSG